VAGAAMVSVNAILFSSKSQIKGLTTAAALWCCGLVGMALGAGLYTVAAISFLALFSSLALFPPIERYMKDNSNHFEIHLELKSKGNLQYFVTTVRSLGIRIEDIESNPAYLNSGLSVYTVSLTINSAELKKYKKHSEIIEALRSLEYIAHIEEINCPRRAGRPRPTSRRSNEGEKGEKTKRRPSAVFPFNRPKRLQERSRHLIF